MGPRLRRLFQTCLERWIDGPVRLASLLDKVVDEAEIVCGGSGVPVDAEDKAGLSFVDACNSGRKFAGA